MAGSEGYSRRVNSCRIGCRLAKADGRRGGLLINGAARYLNDRHRTLQLRHLGEGQAYFARALPPSPRLRRTRRTSKHAILRNEPDWFSLQNTIYPAGLQHVIRIRMRKSNPVRLARIDPFWGSENGGCEARARRRLLRKRRRNKLQFADLHVAVADIGVVGIVIGAQAQEQFLGRDTTGFRWFGVLENLLIIHRGRDQSILKSQIEGVGLTIDYGWFHELRWAPTVAKGSHVAVK